MHSEHFHVTLKPLRHLMVTYYEKLSSRLLQWKRVHGEDIWGQSLQDE